MNLGRFLKRTAIAAIVLAVVLIGVILLLDHFGSQPQPFQYLVH